MSGVLLTLVVPTVAGREDLLARTLDSIEAAAAADFPGKEIEVVTPTDYPCIGEAWNAGMDAADGQWVWLGADDVLAAPGSLLAAVEAAQRGIWPSPRILNHDGTLHSCGTMGQGALMGECPTGTACNSSPFPLVDKRLWSRIGPCIPAHYYADDYLAWAATNIGLRVRVVREYELTHLEGLVGNGAVRARNMEDARMWINAVSEGSPWLA